MNTEPTTVELVAIATAISSTISVLLSIYLSWKKSKPEIKKLEREEESEIVDAAHTTIEGAMISSTMLKERIDELRRELDTEKQARRTDREYFKRRINELEKERSTSAISSRTASWRSILRTPTSTFRLSWKRSGAPSANTRS